MKNYLIVGATSGIGLEVTKNLLINGHSVFGIGRNINELDQLKPEYPKLFTFKYDITSLSSNAVLEAAQAKLGVIDVVFFNSGVAAGGNLKNWPEVYSTIQTNVSGTTEFLINAYHYMKKNNPDGVLAVNTSIAGLCGLRQSPVYGASKAYLINLCQALRAKKNKECKGLTITDIRPGFVDTKMSGGEFWQCPAPKAAEQIIKAIKRKSSVVYISRRWRLIAIILKLLPRVLIERA